MGNARIALALNQASDFNEHIIIADNNLAKASRICFWSELKILDTDRPIFLYRVNLDGKATLDTDANTTNALLYGLSGGIRGMKYDYSIDKKLAMRYAIPAIKKYDILAIRQNIPLGIIRPSNPVCYWIIAPFSREESNKRDQMSKEGFTEMVLSSEAFDRVVEYVRKNSPRSGTVSREEVISAYKNLVEDYYDAVSLFGHRIAEGETE